MKKFGRGFALDFNALMNEVHQPSTPDGDSSRIPSASSGSVDSTDQSPRSRDYARSYSLSSGESGSRSGSSPVDLVSPTEEENHDLGNHDMKRMPTRMSVSRTGRCKNRDRQRLTVLHTEDFYRVPSSGLNKIGASLSSAAENDKTGARKQERDSVEAIDFDSAINALDSSIQAPVITDCYSF